MNTTSTPEKPSLRGRVSLLLLWLLGVPLPVILIIILFRGCTAS